MEPTYQLLEPVTIEPVHGMQGATITPCPRCGASHSLVEYAEATYEGKVIPITIETCL
jgi:hypothetical protein